MTLDLTLLLLAGFLVAAGVYLLVERSITRMLIGLTIASAGVNLLLLAAGGPAGAPPIVGRTSEVSDTSADPLAQAMILTAIVITMGVAAFVLALAYRSFTINVADTVEDDEEDVKVSLRRAPADAPDRDRSDDPVTGEPRVAGDAFDVDGNPIPIEAITNIEDLEGYVAINDDAYADDRRGRETP